jgi:tetratricopeptide (TPR) repeat protein
MAGGLFAFDLELERQKRRFSQSASVSSQAAGGSSPVVQALVELGKKSLARGEFATALSVFQQSAAENPESALTPYCLFECGRISAITGDFDASMRFYRRIVDEYPVASLYDRSRKNLADLHVIRSEYGPAIGELDAMVFIDPGLSREDIEAFREELKQRL